LRVKVRFRSSQPPAQRVPHGLEVVVPMNLELAGHENVVQEGENVVDV
jgi:hypothetical protein